MTFIHNLQRKIQIDKAGLETFAERLSLSVIEDSAKTFSVAFISDRRMKQLNKLFRGIDATTDVLSFPHEPDEFEFLNSPPYEGGVAAVSADGVVLSPAPDQASVTADVENHPTTKAVPLLRKEGSLRFLGDIVISVEQAQKQAAENGLTLEGEIKQLILHGLLHLCGYDHETDNGEMNVYELQLRDKLKI